ncbi:hypothetical protein E1269_26270 [Jiangella asiatica]|uniref:Lipoprotein n=1 Tax=Jiangella asiatica TaxID=2530372 RepID=A0A4R5CRA4_9ACTN|nr:hypothetical protein E1269_26270 [Jiangella asiatica]
MVLLAVLTALPAGCFSGTGSPDASAPSGSTSSTASPSAAAPSRTPSSPPMDTPSPAPTPSPTPSPASTALEGTTLPGGGRTILPDHRLVGFAGGRSASFGRLFTDDLDAVAARLGDVADHYVPDGRRPLPVFELITVIAHKTPAADGLYRTREPDDVIQAYLDTARAHGGLLLLNIQPGRADFLDEVSRLERWLIEPDVGVALDPEWAVGPGQVPGDVYGSTTGAELDSVAAYLASLVRAHDLPEKVMVFHQVHSSVVQDEAALRRHDGVVTIKSVDGIGDRASKEETWRTLMRTKPAHVAAGFKLFFDEDTEQGPLMTPAQVLALTPKPDYVMYE